MTGESTGLPEDGAFRCVEATGPSSVAVRNEPGGLQAVLIAERPRLLRYLVARGAAADAEDVLQDLWQRVSRAASTPIADPVSYLFRAAENLMRDRHRERVARERRERDWSEQTSDLRTAPDAERLLVGSQRLARAEATLAELGQRVDVIFRRFRLDGVSQAVIARDLGVSLSTVEKDLQKAYQALGDLQATFDAE